MKNYLCKWPNGDVVLVSARDRQEVRLILDEVADPGKCEIVLFKGPFAIELNPKMPKRPQRVNLDVERSRNFFAHEFIEPEDPTERPRVARTAGQRATTFPADVWQEAGGQLTPQEAAGLQRWRDATAANAQQQPADAEPWVTNEDLKETGLIDEPYHVQVTLGKTDYGPYTGRLYKGITKAFFPKTYAALKAVQDTQDCFGPRDQSKAKRDEAIKGLAAAVATDIYDEEKDREREKQEAKQWVEASKGNRAALLAVMMDQSANPYGPAAGDQEEEDEDSDLSGDGDDSDGGFDVMQGIRAGRAAELAAMFGAGR